MKGRAGAHRFIIVSRRAREQAGEILGRTDDAYVCNYLRSQLVGSRMRWQSEHAGCWDVQGQGRLILTVGYSQRPDQQQPRQIVITVRERPKRRPATTAPATPPATKAA